MEDYYETPPKKSLGQHWLNDPAALGAICDAADIRADDTVLEVGPGQGSLTRLLVGRANRLVAVEFDANLAAELPRRIVAPNLEVSNQDILSFDLTSLPKGYKLIGNIPYYLTSNLVRVISESSNPPDRAVLLIQKEVAERVAAKPGDMSILSVTAQFYWQVELGLVVPARLFVPPPKVDSQVLILKQLTRPLLPASASKDFFRLVKAGFSQRRKTLINSLSAGLNQSREEAASVCERASINPGRRAQTLSLDEWQRLYSAIFH